ncbi:MAG: universal stress protein [Planctomycetota bacterium]
MKTRKILLTTDLSEESLRPFDPVAELARRNGASILLLHVVEDLGIAPHGAPLAPRLHSPGLEEEIAEARKKLEEIRAGLPGDLPVSAEVIPAVDIAQGVSRFARNEGVDLLALSTHGRTGLRRLVLGSVAEAILRHSEVPVLCFPPPRKGEPGVGS